MVVLVFFLGRNTCKVAGHQSLTILRFVRVSGLPTAYTKFGVSICFPYLNLVVSTERPPSWAIWLIFLRFYGYLLQQGVRSSYPASPWGTLVPLTSRARSSLRVQKPLVACKKFDVFELFKFPGKSNGGNTRHPSGNLTQLLRDRSPGR